jgi:hypothetical protein
MTTTSSPPREVPLNLFSFDAPGKVVTDWLTQWLDNNWPKETGLWLLLEQMHRFDFVGPNVADIRPLITEDALSTYGLRGRLFWKVGQIEWRRLSPQTLRVVAMTEGANSVIPPGSVKTIAKTSTMEFHDGCLILWGKSRDKKGGGKEFVELRVAGSTPIEYPAFIENIAAGIKGTSYPVLPFRTYISNTEGREEFRRFLPPTVCDEQSLQNPLTPKTLTEEEVHYA